MPEDYSNEKTDYYSTIYFDIWYSLIEELFSNAIKSAGQLKDGEVLVKIEYKDSGLLRVMIENTNNSHEIKGEGGIKAVSYILKTLWDRNFGIEESDDEKKTYGMKMKKEENKVVIWIDIPVAKTSV